MTKIESSLDEKTNEFSETDEFKIGGFTLSELEENLAVDLKKKYEDIPLYMERMADGGHYSDVIYIAFVIEALILSDNMRDKRLTYLDQEDVEKLAMDLYLNVDKMREEGDGYMEMGDAADNIIDKHLSHIDAEASQ